MHGPRHRQVTLALWRARPVCSWWVAALVCAATVAVAGTSIPEAAVDDWYEARTPRFSVYSQRGESDAARAARHLARLAEVIEQTTTGLSLSDRQLRVIEFRDREAFQSLGLIDASDESWNQGYSVVTRGFRVRGPDVELITYYRDDTSPSTSVASHEYVHVLMGGSFEELPIWINEGLAEFYSSFKAGSRTADVGRPISEHVQLLRRSGRLPLKLLMKIGPDSPEYRFGTQRAVIYAESWALVHMLATANQGQDARFSKLLLAFREGLSSERALVRAYGPNAVDSLGSALDQYLVQMTMGWFSWRFAEDAVDIPVTIRPLEPVETVRLLGELCLRTPRAAPVARKLLQASWTSDSSSVIAAALLAELESSERDDSQAMRWREAVVRVPHPEPRALGLTGLALADLRFRSNYTPSWPARGADSTTLIARRLLEEALQAEPNRIEWLVPYGLTFIDEATGFSPGMSALFTAREAEPWRTEVSAGLAILNIRAGGRASARNLYLGLPKTKTGLWWSARVGYLLAERTLEDAERMYRAGRSGEADSLLVQLAHEVSFPGLQARVRSVLERIGGEDATRALPDNTALEAFGYPGMAEVLLAAGRGDYETAERSLKPILEAARPEHRAVLDTLSIGFRHGRRLAEARKLLHAGRRSEACKIWKAILLDQPRAPLREYLEEQLRENCERGR